MKTYLKVLLGTFVLVLAGVAYAAVTVNGDACGELDGNVQITPGGDVIINTTESLCGNNRGNGGTTNPPPPTTTTYNLTIAANNGTVARSAGGTSCGTNCYTYNDGTSVTLTASANSGYSFSGWSGACTNPSGTCTVSMTAARSVTANFQAVVAGDSCNPSGTTVRSEDYPSQSVSVDLAPNEILSYPLPKANGRIAVVRSNYASNAAKYMVVSTCPGDISSSGKSRSCYSNGAEDATVWYGLGTSCDISGNQTYYVNISHISFSGRQGCTTRTCGFTVR